MHTMIPEPALGQHIAILGKTGSGKTTSAKSAIVEPLLAAGRRVGIVDPTGAWWGLRSSRDGKRPGFPVLVLGGDHGDLPLVPSSGAAVARLLVEQGVNLVADTSLMTVGERTRWFIAFAGTVYRANRAPLHLVLDEAHNFAPKGKIPDPDTGKMLHATNTLASGGRSRGIRLTMLTQRPQKLHNDALTSADTLVAMRVLAPHDRAAIEDWIKGAADIGAAREVLASLAGLPRGTGWVWYPEGGFLQKVAFPPAITFDSSATPEDGAAPAPKSAADIDLTEIKAAMAEAVAEAEANDPKRLRAHIAQLEKALAVGGAPDRATLDAEFRKGTEAGYREALQVFTDKIGTLQGALVDVGAAADALSQAAHHVPENVTAIIACRPAEKAQAGRRSAGRASEPSPAPRAPAGAGVGMSKAERLIMTALAQYPAGRTKIQVAVLTDYSHTGGGFNNALSSLRTKGWIEGGPDHLITTAAGDAALGDFEPLPTGAALRDHWLAKVSKAERAILGALFGAYPSAMSKETLAQVAGYEASGGGFNNALSRLRTLELITRGALICASEDFYQ